MKNPAYRPGDAYALCDRCGFRFHKSELKKTWDNLMVCRDDFETRHPQDLIKVKQERISIKDARPQGQDVFLSPGDVTADDL